MATAKTFGLTKTQQLPATKLKLLSALLIVSSTVQMVTPVHPLLICCAGMVIELSDFWRGPKSKAIWHTHHWLCIVFQH
jgi:hypothetical protein